MPGVRVAFLDGCVELITLGEEHEEISRFLSMLLGLYFLERGIEFIPVGSATREAEEQGASFQPDESYYIGQRRAHPHLAIEVIITSGKLAKLEKYQRFGIDEVWFWENDTLALYRLRNDGYEAIARSEFLPDLDPAVLVACVKQPSKLEAMNAFLAAIRG
jgi:Uma2 family endonuclease